MQAILIFFLAFTGFEIHGTYSFFGFRDAVRYHNVAAYMFIGLIVFAIFCIIGCKKDNTNSDIAKEPVDFYCIENKLRKKI